uniref:Uncharacterized protein n=1 Tax=viral metagenome TaxID=1070528 RepID=A0A6M3IU94_9ZZZZ
MPRTMIDRRLRWRIRKRAQRAFPVMRRCERCGGGVYLQRHHPRLDQPLRVVVLCQRCHANLHIKNGTWGTMK